MSRLSVLFFLVPIFAVNVNIDLNQLFGPFQGIGALSGGGGTSRLLYDYPEPHRSIILDALFVPNKGASLQLIKVEMGGDAQSTEATEASHMHTRDDQNYNRGYEWWILEEAKKRNPDILTYGLVWGAPGWIGNGNYWSQDNIDYHINWVQGLLKYHNIYLDYMGIWNEEGYNRDWIVQLRSALNNAGFAKTKILAYDNSYDGICDDLQNDTQFRNAVQALGAHYGNAPHSNCFNLGLPLWTSEGWDLSSLGDWSGATQLSRDISNAFINFGNTGFIIWNLIFSWYAIFDFAKPDSSVGGQGHSLMYAAEPWTGHYSIQPPIYVVAHYTQFTRMNNRCQYISPQGTGTSGYVDSSKKSSIVVFLCDNADVSIVIETTQVSAQQNVTFQLTNLPFTLPSSLHVWRTNQTDWFVPLTDVSTQGENTFNLILDGGSIFTITTTSGQNPVPPPSTPIPPSTRQSLPYFDNFDSYTDQATVKYLTDQGGSFNAAPTPGGSGMSLQQAVIQKPIQWVWGPNPDPYTTMGDYTSYWSNYNLTSSVYVVNSFLGWNAVVDVCNTNQKANQQWIYTNNQRIKLNSNNSYCLAPAGYDAKYPSNYNAGVVLCNESDSMTQWIYQSNTSALVNGALSGQCLDVEGASTTNDSNVFIYPCNYNSNEQWKFNTENLTITSMLDGDCLTLNPDEQVFEAGGDTYAQLCGRISTQSRGTAPIGYCLRVDFGSQTWKLTTNTATLGSGNVPFKVSMEQWYTLSISFANTTISATLNGVTLATVKDGTYGYGMIALGSGWHQAFF